MTCIRRVDTGPPMGLAQNDRRIQIAAAAAQTVFDCDFPVAGAADLEVWRTRAGASALLAMPADYTLSNLGLTSAGRVTLAAGALAGDVYTLSGRRAEVRATDFLTSGDFRADDIDAELDRIYVGLQELRRDIDRRPGPGVDSALTGLIDLPEQAATAPPADTARVYAKDVAGETHLFVRTATKEINLSAGSTGPTGASGPVAIDYTWDTGTAAADPGPGKVRASVGTFAGSFSLYISETDRLGNNLAALLQSWDDSTSTIRGKLEVIDLVAPANRMYCAVTGTVSDGGVFDTISVTYLSGVTSFAAVNVGLLFFRSGDRGADGLGAGDLVAANNLSDLASKKTAYDNLSVRGADIASAATIDLDAATGNLVDVTGTTTVTAITLASGRERTVRFTGILTLTNGASLVLPGGANITTAAGDYAVLRGYAAGVVRCVAYTKANGQAVVGGAGGGSVDFELPTNLSLAASVAGSDLTIAVKDTAGSNPSGSTTIPFRNAAVANGARVVRSLAAALSITVPATQTLGTANSSAFRYWVVAIDNAGVVELAVINCLVGGATPTAIAPLDDTALITTTAIASAPSAATFYSATARANVAMRILGYIEYGSGLVSAGVYASVPTRVQLFGPGVPRPGSVVQQKVMSTTTVTSVVNSTTPVATALTQSITPTSAANVIAALCAAPGQVNSTTVGGMAQLGRNSSANLIGSTGTWFTAAAGNSNVPGMLAALDKPNTVAATTYTAYIFNGSAGTGTFTLPATNYTNTGSLRLEEIAA